MASAMIEAQVYGMRLEHAALATEHVRRPTNAFSGLNFRSPLNPGN
jgi:hypothetical protein